MTTTDSKSSKTSARVVGFAVAAALLAVPAAGNASTSFGAKLSPDVQPSNAGEAHPCIPGEQPTTACTRVLMDAYGRPDQPNAPKSGRIKRIKLIAGEAGTFRLQIVKANPQTQRAKLVRNGPVINYQGQPAMADPDEAVDSFRVEKFKVNVKVKKGQYLAIQSTETSTLRCSSGGPNQLVFSGPLAFGQGFRDADTTDGCWLLLEAKMK